MLSNAKVWLVPSRLDSERFSKNLVQHFRVDFHCYVSLASPCALSYIGDEYGFNTKRMSEQGMPAETNQLKRILPAKRDMLFCCLYGARAAKYSSGFR